MIAKHQTPVRRLRPVRKALGLTPEDMASLLGCSYATIINAESGATKGSTASSRLFIRQLCMTLADQATAKGKQVNCQPEVLVPDIFGSLPEVAQP